MITTIKNIEMVRFLNYADTIKTRKLPINLSFAIRSNINQLISYAKIYNEERAKIEKEEIDESEKNKKYSELALTEIEVNLTMVKCSDIASLDVNKYDGFSHEEVQFLDIMLTC